MMRQELLQLSSYLFVFILFLSAYFTVIIQHFLVSRPAQAGQTHNQIDQSYTVMTNAMSHGRCRLSLLWKTGQPSTR